MKRPALKPQVKLGAEKNKVIALVALVAVAIVVYFWQSSGSPSNPSSSQQTPLRPVPAVPTTLPNRAPVRPATRMNIGRSGVNRTGTQEFRPTLKPKDPIDPSRVDPTLKLSLLAKLKNVNIEGGGRSLFDFSGAPAPADKVAIASVKPIVPGHTAMAFVGPLEPKKAPETPPPPPTPIPLKFYGFTNALHQGKKRAFFLEGEDIFVAGEGDLIKNRYKVVRIGVNSAEVEDTTDKHKQTLPLEAEQVNS